MKERATLTGCVTPQWAAPAPVRALMTTRQTAVEEGAALEARGFNLALHVGDEPARVMAHRARLGEWAASPLAWLDQVHGTRVVAASEVYAELAAGRMVQADACVSFAPHQACVVMTADCLPILLCSTDGVAIAAIHAGWRGLVKGVIAATVQRLQAGHAAPYLAWIGVGISQAAFEVGPEVRAEFLAAGFADAAFIPSHQPAHYYADLTALAQEALIQAGVTQVSQAAACTFNQPQRFYSHRRDSAQGTPQGRMATVITRGS